MNHPEYVYTPASEVARARMREAHRKRLGNMPGHYRVYGIQVPEAHAPLMRQYGAIVANFTDYATAKKFVEDARTNAWDVTRPDYTAWGQRDWQLYRDLIAEGMSREDVAKYANVVEWYLNRGVLAHRNGRRK